MQLFVCLYAYWGRSGRSKVAVKSLVSNTDPITRNQGCWEKGASTVRSESLHRSAHMEARLTSPPTGPTGDSGVPNYMTAVVDHKSSMKPGAHVDINTLKSEEEWHFYTKCLP